MNNRQIECFLEVGSELNVTKAAQNLYLPQPTVSRYIQALEEELGVALFIREGKRKIRFSEAGKVYFSMFQKFREEFRNTQRVLYTSQKTLCFGYSIGWSISAFLPDIITLCRKKHPDMYISIECMEMPELLSAVLNRRLDAILIFL